MGENRSMATPLAIRSTQAALNGLSMVVYYGCPDVVHTRRARVLVRAAATAAALAAAIPDLRDGAAELREASGELRQAREALRELPIPARLGLVATGAGFTALTVIGSVRFEKWAFRTGEARRLAGEPLAHTRTGLVMGAIALVSSLIPPPQAGGGGGGGGGGDDEPEAPDFPPDPEELDIEIPDDARELTAVPA